MHKTGLSCFRAALVAATAALLPLGAARADGPGIATGTLTCNAAPGPSFVFGASYGLDCTYVPVQGRAERYLGEVRRVGIDLGFRANTTLVWAVIVGSDGKPDSLAGSYVGVSVGATPVVGAGANALVGGSDRTISLQPLSVELRTGLNVNVAVANLTLRRP